MMSNYYNILEADLLCLRGIQDEYKAIIYLKLWENTIFLKLFLHPDI